MWFDKRISCICPVSYHHYVTMPVVAVGLLQFIVTLTVWERERERERVIDVVRTSSSSTPSRTSTSTFLPVRSAFSLLRNDMACVRTTTNYTWLTTASSHSTAHCRQTYFSSNSTQSQDDKTAIYTERSNDQQTDGLVQREREREIGQ